MKGLFDDLENLNVADRPNADAELRGTETPANGPKDGEAAASTPLLEDEAEPDRSAMTFGEGDPWT